MPERDVDALTREVLHRAVPVTLTEVDAASVVERGDALRRRRTVTRVALALALLLPAGVVVSVLRAVPQIDVAEGGGSVRATLTATEAPPEVLVDGSTPGTVPDVVRARFDQPVVGTARAATVPEPLAERCAGPPSTRSPADASAARLQRLADAAGEPLVHVGPRMLSLLRVGSAASPPGYPDAYAVTCVGYAGGEGEPLVTRGAALEHLYDGWTGFILGVPALAPTPRADVTPPLTGDGARSALWTSAVPVPTGASWAVQEQSGWWLAYDVDGSGWMLVQAVQDIPAGAFADPMYDIAFPGGRVVFLDAAGRVVADERLGTDAIPADAPFLRSQATAARIHLGEETALRAELAHGPVPACAEERTVCVWVTLDGEEVVALSAASPLPIDVPPFGFVGWCPAEGAFAESVAGSRFGPDGRWQQGPAPTDLHRYAVTVVDGDVVVDLAAFTFGADRPPQTIPKGPPPAPPCDGLVDPGFALP